MNGWRSLAIPYSLLVLRIRRAGEIDLVDDGDVADALEPENVVDLLEDLIESEALLVDRLLERGQAAFRIGRGGGVLAEAGGGRRREDIPSR